MLVCGSAMASMVCNRQEDEEGRTEQQKSFVLIGMVRVEMSRSKFIGHRPEPRGIGCSQSGSRSGAKGSSSFKR